MAGSDDGFAAAFNGCGTRRQSMVRWRAPGPRPFRSADARLARRVQAGEAEARLRGRTAAPCRVLHRPSSSRACRDVAATCPATIMSCRGSATTPRRVPGARVFDDEQVGSGECRPRSVSMRVWRRGPVPHLEGSLKDRRDVQQCQDIRLVSLPRMLVAGAAAASAPPLVDAAARATGEGSPLLGSDDPELHVAL